MNGQVGLGVAMVVNDHVARLVVLRYHLPCATWRRAGRARRGSVR